MKKQSKWMAAVLALVIFTWGGGTACLSETEDEKPPEALEEMEEKEMNVPALNIGGRDYNVKDAEARNKIDDLKSALNAYELKLFNVGDIVKNSYVRVDEGHQGEFETYSGWDRSDYIPVFEYDTLTIKSGVASHNNAFYTKNKTFISVFTYETTDKVISIPNNAYYCVVSNTAAGLLATSGSFTLRADKEIEKISKLKDAIAFNDGSYPFISIDSWVEGSYIDASDGSFKNDDGWHRSGYIEIGNTDGGMIHFDNTKGSNSLYNVFYDENHTKVGRNFNTNNADITIPANAVYFAVSIEKAYFVSANKPIVTLINRATKESVNNFIQKYGKNELFSSIVKGSYVDRSDGSFVLFSGWDRTDYIDISFFEAILVESDTSTPYNAFYSSGKTFIKSFGITSGVNKIVIPEGAGYVVFSCEDDYIESIKVHKSYISESGGGSSGENGKSFMQDECLLLRNNLPSYYTSYPQTASTYTAGAYIDLKADEVSLADKNFIFITDVHWTSNAKQSNKLIAYLRKKLHIYNVIHGGDILDYDQDSPHLASVHMREWVDEARAAAGSGLLPVQGNHDINTGSGRSDEQTEQDIMPYAIAESIQLDGSKPFIVQETDEQIAARIASITFDSTADRNDVIAYYKLHYYYDDSKNKIRYIILNHGTHLNGIIHKYFNVRQFGEVFLQMDWLYETLMSTPDDYTVVVAMHAFINWGTNKVESGPFQVCNLLSGYKQKDPNRRITNSNQISGNVYPYGYHYYDFSNAKKPNGIICLGGDMHWDYAYVVRTAEGAESGAYTDSLAQHPDSIVVVHTQTDAYGRTYPPGTYLSDTWPMEQGTVTEQCFDIVSIEQYNENYVKAKFTRIGAGEDREFLLNLQQQ